MIRLREFTQAEAEIFVHPVRKKPPPGVSKDTLTIACLS